MSNRWMREREENLLMLQQREQQRELRRKLQEAPKPSEPKPTTRFGRSPSLHLNKPESNGVVTSKIPMDAIVASDVQVGELSLRFPRVKATLDNDSDMMVFIGPVNEIEAINMIYGR